MEPLVEDDTSALTCPSCNATVTQAAGTKRTICPHCGNFYDPDKASLISRNQNRNRGIENTKRRRAHPEHKRQQTSNHGRKSKNADCEDKTPSGGRLQSLANFFHNLGPGRRSKSTDSAGQARNEMTLRQPSPVPSAPCQLPVPECSRPGSATSITTLPHIPLESKGRLTVDTPLLPMSPSQLSVSQRMRLQSYEDPETPLDQSGHHSRPSSGRRKRPISGHTNRSSFKQSLSNQETRTTNQTRSAPHIYGKTAEELRDEVSLAESTGKWKAVQDYYATVFDCFTELNMAFKRDPNKDYKTVDDSGLRLDYIFTMYDLLLDLPQEIQKIVLKAVINSLLKDRRPHTKDDLRAYLILLQNPQFCSTPTYVIFAHLLRQIASLPDQDHHFLVHWLKRLQSGRFKVLITKLQSFISCRLFPPKPQDLPPMAKCTWWIPSATKVLALLNAANNLSSPQLVPYTHFYNQTLELLDLMAEYYAWQNPSAHPGFSVCQYPFVLSIAAKRTVLQRDSEQQMITMARRSLVAKVQRRQQPDIGMIFLNLTVRRAHLVSDSLNEIARQQHDLKKKLKVTFAGEPGLDMGGLTKEWFLLLIRQIFRQDYGMFIYNKHAGNFWFSTAPCENYQEFNLVGVLMGLAVYNSINLDVHFPSCCYKKLLSPAVVPYNNPRAVVGVASMALKDLQEPMPDLAQGLRDLLNYEGDVEDDFGLTFQISFTELGCTKTHALKAGGDEIPVTNKNRKEYVQLYVDFLLNKSIYRQFQAFYHGFHSVCASNALIMLRPEEVEMLVCGSPDINMCELKKVTVYDGYQATDPTIRYFWEVVFNLVMLLQKQLLLFTTGSDRIPVGGMSEMQFKITRVSNLDMLPMAHTCFNQLVLPAYRNRKVLKQKLLIAIQNAEGFGIE